MLSFILIFILVMASLNLINEIKEIVICFIRERKYELPILRRLFSWASIAYILTIIIVGI